MATASPTPVANGLVRRTSARQALGRPFSRSLASRSEHQQSQASQFADPPALSTRSATHNQSQQQQQQQQETRGNDSSDEEIPVPMKLSALTKALLDEDVPVPADKKISPSRIRTRSTALNASTLSATQERRSVRSNAAPEIQERKQSQPPSLSREQSQEPSPIRKRIVRLSHTPQSLGEIQPSKQSFNSGTRASQRSRPVSWQSSKDAYTDAASADQQAPSEGEEPKVVQRSRSNEVNTPAQGRVVRIVTGSSGKRSRLGSAGPSSASRHDRSFHDKAGMSGDEEYPQEGPETVARNAPAVSFGSISRYSRDKSEENPNPMSSIRVKRTGKLSGAYLSGPARRGGRRQSEKDGEDGGDGESMLPGQQLDGQGNEQTPGAFFGDGLSNFNAGSPVGGNAASARASQRNASSANLRREHDRLLANAVEPLKLDDSPPQIWVPKLEIPSTHDQENEVPSSYKRAKPSVDQILEKIPLLPQVVEVHHAKIASPERRPLGALSQNTPLRAAPPPPPKMPVLDAARSAAGTATAEKGKARRNILKVNGKNYTRLDCLGRGGTSKVYRVTTETGKMFALKRVLLEGADETAIRGYKGEIDLLSKLKDVERVISLEDYELNEEKKVLTMVMEMGEIDFHNLLKNRQKLETSKFDPVSVRFYWKEMLECLQSVHQHDIVHSDLKPANFVSVMGCLKLIDFGIADAIQTDETVNVHRENHIGTPNFMSPESLLDSNSPRGGRLPGRPKLMKLGKPSDVWSLGCILYLMVYGAPPFGHIVNHMARCHAIINFDHRIDFPSRGVGGVLVPPSLLRTMKRCLNRDPAMRPTCDELLHHTDPFLHPAELNDKALPIDEEMLGRVISSIVTRCQERMPTEQEMRTTWPSAYWASIKKATAGRL